MSKTAEDTRFHYRIIGRSLCLQNYMNQCNFFCRGCVSMFLSLYVLQSLCSPVFMFSVLCSPVSMFPGLMFPGIYVPQQLCSPVSMFPRPMLPSIYVPQYLCSPVPVFSEFYNKRLRDAKSVISVILLCRQSVRLSIRSRFSR